MHTNSIGRRSSTNPVRISMLDREDKSLTRNDQRRTQTLKPKGCLTVEGSQASSHIPRPRFRSSSSDRAASLSRKSCLKTSSRTPLHQPTTPVTPVRSSSVHNLASSFSALKVNSNRLHAPLAAHRSPSVERVGSKGPRKDTRPLMDKNYQMSLLNKIDNFFHVNQASTMLNSNGSLKPITLKMFVEVSNFLLKIFDIKQELTMMNYVEELPKCAKKLHYPGTITKSWLKTANAMHSWPQVLGWIGWLVEACQVRELAFSKYQLETIPFLGTEEEARNNKMEFLTLLECYRAWNDEKHDEEAELFETYLQRLQIEQGTTEEDIVQAHKELEEESSKLQIMEEESQRLEETVERLRAELLSLQAKENMQIQEMENMADYIQKASAETNQLNAECQALNEQLRIGNIRRKELIAIVKDQPMSKAEKENIVKQCTEIRNFICEFDKHLKDYQKDAYTLDIQLASSNNNLNKLILAYNKELFMHKEIFADNTIIHMDVNFNQLKLPEKGLLDPQIMNILEEKATIMKSIKESLTKQCDEIESFIRSNTIKLEKMQEEMNHLLLEKRKLEQEKAHINKMKADMKKEEDKLMKQIEAMNNEIKEIQDMMPDEQAIDLEIEEAKDKLEALTRRKTFLEQSAKQFYKQWYAILNEHRGELYNILTRDQKKD